MDNRRALLSIEVEDRHTVGMPGRGTKTTPVRGPEDGRRSGDGNWQREEPGLDRVEHDVAENHRPRGKAGHLPTTQRHTATCACVEASGMIAEARLEALQPRETRVVGEPGVLLLRRLRSRRRARLES
jgi:hypothetical protein